MGNQKIVTESHIALNFMDLGFVTRYIGNTGTQPYNRHLCQKDILFKPNNKIILRTSDL